MVQDQLSSANVAARCSSRMGLLHRRAKGQADEQPRHKQAETTSPWNPFALGTFPSSPMHVSLWHQSSCLIDIQMSIPDAMPSSRTFFLSRTGELQHNVPDAAPHAHGSAATRSPAGQNWNYCSHVALLRNDRSSCPHWLQGSRYFEISQRVSEPCRAKFGRRDDRCVAGVSQLGFTFTVIGDCLNFLCLDDVACARSVNRYKWHTAYLYYSTICSLLHRASKLVNRLRLDSDQNPKHFGVCKHFDHIQSLEIADSDLDHKSSGLRALERHIRSSVLRSLRIERVPPSWVEALAYPVNLEDLSLDCTIDDRLYASLLQLFTHATYLRTLDLSRAGSDRLITLLNARECFLPVLSAPLLCGVFGFGAISAWTCVPLRPSCDCCSTAHAGGSQPASSAL